LKNHLQWCLEESDFTKTGTYVPLVVPVHDIKSPWHILQEAYGYRLLCIGVMVLLNQPSWREMQFWTENLQIVSIIAESSMAQVLLAASRIDSTKHIRF